MWGITAYVSLSYLAGWSVVGLSPLVLLFPHFFNFYCILNLVCVCVHMHVYAIAWVKGHEQPWQSVLSFYHMGPRD